MVHIGRSCKKRLVFQRSPVVSAALFAATLTSATLFSLPCKSQPAPNAAPAGPPSRVLPPTTSSETKRPQPLPPVALQLVQSDEIGDTFELIDASYTLDGELLHGVSAAVTGLPKQNRYEVFRGLVAAGARQFGVRLLLRGRGLGVFTYMRGYQVQLMAHRRLSLARGPRRVVVRLRERPIDFIQRRFYIEIEVTPSIVPSRRVPRQQVLGSLLKR